MEQEEKLKIEEDIVKMLKTVYDPELPVDVYSLGLIYKIDLGEDGHVDIDMPVIVKVDLVNQPQTVNVNRQFRVIDRLQHLNDVFLNFQFFFLFH